MKILQATSPHESVSTPAQCLSSAPSISVSNRFESLQSIKSVEDSFQTIVHKKPKRRSLRLSQHKQQLPKLRHHAMQRVGKSAKSPTTTAVPFKRITIAGDSHSRHLASLVKEMIPCSTSITGVCKPGAGLLDIAPTSNSFSSHCYVIIAGTNDVAAGRQDIILDHMEAVLHQCREDSTVLVCPLTPRHDLPPTSPIHDVISRTNLHISNICSRMERVEMLDISSIGRQLYTTHGLHLRLGGKRQLARVILKKMALMRPPPSLPPQTAATTTTPTPRPPPPSPPRSMPRMLSHDSFAEAVKSSRASPERAERAASTVHPPPTSPAVTSRTNQGDGTPQHFFPGKNDHAPSPGRQQNALSQPFFSSNIFLGNPLSATKPN